jgi:hypothetical protein
MDERPAAELEPVIYKGDPAMLPSIETVDTTVLEIVAEMQTASASAAIFPDIAALEQQIATVRAGEEAAVASQYENSHDMRILLDVGPSEQALRVQLDNEYKVINSDPRYSPEGKKLEREKADEEARKRQERIQAVEEEHAQRLVAQSPPPVRLKITPEVSAEIQALSAGLQWGTPEGTNALVVDTLKTAMNAAIPAAERYRANQILETLWLPVMQRRATAPEKFARASQPVAERLAAMIQDHLDIVKGGLRHRIASDHVRRIRQDLRAVRNMTRQNGAPLDDFILETLSPSIFGKKK